MIYLDNAATTMMGDGVFDAMVPYLKDSYGNPGGKYSIGRDAARAVQCARMNVAQMINASADDIIFTSGGSESNSLAIHGFCEMEYSARGRFHAVCSSIEHHSVIEAFSRAVIEMCDVTFVHPNKDGVVTRQDVEKEIKEDTRFVCVMHTNNETGAVNDVAGIGKLCKERSIVFFTDCVQATGISKLDVEEMNCDMLSISSHKIHGPKGVGALYCRDKHLIRSIIYGGEKQEFGKRGGTENVPGIVGFGEACCDEIENGERNAAYVSHLKYIFCERLMAALMETDCDVVPRVNVRSCNEPGKVVSLTIPGVDSETVVMLLDAYGVCISSGSACNSFHQEPSAVLLESGLTEEDARSTVRVSFSRMNTQDEVLNAANIMAKCIRILTKEVTE